MESNKHTYSYILTFDRRSRKCNINWIDIWSYKSFGMFPALASWLRRPPIPPLTPYAPQLINLTNCCYTKFIYTFWEGAELEGCTAHGCIMGIGDVCDSLHRFALLQSLYFCIAFRSSDLGLCRPWQRQPRISLSSLSKGQKKRKKKIKIRTTCVISAGIFFPSSVYCGFVSNSFSRRGTCQRCNLQ